MATLPESATWTAGVYQLEENDPVLGGIDGIDNQQAKDLANRTVWLKQNVDSLVATRGGGYSAITTFTGGAGAGNLVAGRLHMVTGINIDSSGLVLTLPSATTAGAGAAVVVTGVNAGVTSTTIGPLTSFRAPVVIQRSGSDLIQANDSTNTSTSVSIINGETIVFVSNGSNRWFIAQWQRADLVPAGTIAWFGATSAPEGYLKCNGAAVSRTTYANLFAAIGTTFGAGNGSTTFNLPDLRGEFVRGWDDGRGVDSGRAFGSAQAQAIQAHTHSITQNGNDAITPTGGTTNFRPGGDTSASGSTGSTGGTETRPRNVALLAVIKF